MKSSSLPVLGFIFLVSPAIAQPIVNPPLPIVQQVNVRVIGVANTDGSNTAPLFGTIGQQATIFSMVDTIWAQAGIDVNFTFVPVPPATYNNSFANIGTPGSNNPRPQSDLGTIISNANSAGGILDPNSNTINLFMVKIVPGFSQTSDNTANGLANLSGNGIAMWAGPNLPSFTGGQTVIASVLAHEIGHNLGLPHIVEGQNLMQAGGSPNQGERLNATQITTALASPFSVPIPEPMVSPFLLVLGIAAVWRRREKNKLWIGTASM